MNKIIKMHHTTISKWEDLSIIQLIHDIEQGTERENVPLLRV